MCKDTAARPNSDRAQVIENGQIFAQPTGLAAVWRLAVHLKADCFNRGDLIGAPLKQSSEFDPTVKFVHLAVNSSDRVMVNSGG